MRYAFALTFLLSTTGQLVSLSNAIITMEEIEKFDPGAAEAQALTLLGDSDDPSSSRSSSSFGLFGTDNVNPDDLAPRDRIFGQSCNEGDRTCQENLYCAQTVIGKRCFPTANDCLGNLATDFHSSFNFEELAEEISANAGVGVSDLANARRSAKNFEEFQETDAFTAFARAFQANAPLDALRKLQSAADECMAMATTAPPTSNRMLLEGTSGSIPPQDEPETASSSGSITYMGLHLELGVIADVTMSLFWALGDNNEPTSFIRGSFGVEAGAGAELVGLVGLSFSGSTKDILGDAVAFDADVAAVLVGLGMAVIQNVNNGVTSLEFTGIGPGLGLGIFGVSYAITGKLNPSSPAPSAAPITVVPTTTVPTKSPTKSPTKFPTKSPTKAPTKAPSACPTATPATGNDMCTSAVAVSVGNCYSGTVAAFSSSNECRAIADCGCEEQDFFYANVFKLTNSGATTLTVNVEACATSPSMGGRFLLRQDGTVCTALGNCNLVPYGTCPAFASTSLAVAAGSTMNFAFGLYNRPAPETFDYFLKFS